MEKIKVPDAVLKSEFKNEGTFPIIDQSEKFIAGFCDDETKLIRISKPVICFGDHTRIFKYVDFDFVLGADGVKVLQTKPEILPEYLYYVLRNTEIKSLGYSRHYKILKEILIPVPPVEIQLEIVSEIEQYQKIINGARQIVDNYRPTININSQWETAKVGDVVDFISGVTLSVGECLDSEGSPLITIADVGEDGKIYTDGIRTVSTTKKTNKLRKGDLLFNWRNGSKSLVGKTALFDLDGDYIFASFLLGLRPHENIDSKFLWVLLNQFRVEGKYMQFMRQNVNGLFNREELQEVTIPVPTIEIQREIVSAIEEEMIIIEYNKRLIEIFEKKIQIKLSEVWGE